jgi:hypothetical protein
VEDERSLLAARVTKKSWSPSFVTRPRRRRRTMTKKKPAAPSKGETALVDD